MGNANRVGSGAALVSAFFYGVSVPFVKILEVGLSATWVSALLYTGAGIAMILLACGLRVGHRRDALGGKPLGIRQIPLLAIMVLLNTASAVALVAGIALSSAAAASLLGNLEIVATVVLAWIIFREPITKRFIGALIFITLSGFLLGWEGDGGLLSPGAILIMLACVFWGFENNCTRALSEYDVIAVTRVKGFFTGASSAVLTFIIGDSVGLDNVLSLLAVGAVSYGVSIALYIWAQRLIGAARTSNFYSIAPFIGVAASWLLFGIDTSPIFWVACAFAIIGVVLTWQDTMNL